MFVFQKRGFTKKVAHTHIELGIFLSNSVITIDHRYRRFWNLLAKRYGKILYLVGSIRRVSHSQHGFHSMNRDKVIFV
jgi:hypothetical protein